MGLVLGWARLWKQGKERKKMKRCGLSHVGLWGYREVGIKEMKRREMGLGLNSMKREGK